MPDFPSSSLTRRDFLVTGAKFSAALLAAPYIARAAAASAGGTKTVNVALIGCGEQGRVLLNASLKIPDIRGNIHTHKRKQVESIANAILIAGLLAERQGMLGGAAGLFGVTKNVVGGA